MLTHVCGLQETLSQERDGVPEGQVETQPASVIVVRVSDKQLYGTGKGTAEELLGSVDAAQELMRDKFKKDLKRIVDEPGTHSLIASFIVRADSVSAASPQASQVPP